MTALTGLQAQLERRGGEEGKRPLSLPPAPRCQRASVFLGAHEIGSLPDGKQYSAGGSHSNFMF